MSSRLLGFVSSIQTIPITEARKLITRFSKIMQPREVVKITVSEKPTFALMDWKVFEDMFDIIQTVEDPLVMQEFSAFLRDKNKPHPFTDIMRAYYTKVGVIDRFDGD